VNLTERQKQEDRARRSGNPFRWCFELDNGQRFDAVAMNKYGALHVLNKELPGRRAHLVLTIPARFQA
jgi:hypothetical protein